MQTEAFNSFLKGSKKELKKKIILMKNDKKTIKKLKITQKQKYQKEAL